MTDYSSPIESVLDYAHHNYCICITVLSTILCPAKCVCSENFTIDHALSCPHGAFPTLCHNEIRNLTGTLLTEVCPDVSLEPVLQLLSGEVLNFATSNHENETQVAVAVRDFWTHGQKTF